jgi:putative transposase
MDGSITLKASERKTLLKYYRKSSDPAVRLRAHILLLLAEGHTWNLIAAMLYTSTSTIARWKARFEREGLGVVVESRRGRPAVFLYWWAALVVRWVTQTTPRDFGFLRSRWACATVVLLLAERHCVQVSAETIRRWLHREKIVWRRPRPVLGPKDPKYHWKLRSIQRLLATLPDDETAVFQDEVDINTNPKIGSMWMPCGQQAEVVTPGNNVKRHLAGSLHWRTGLLLVSAPGMQRNSDLFVRHLDDLRRRLRCYRRIHVICDNAKFHDCAKVRRYLDEQGRRIVIHFLPTYAPKTNPIERVWWHLHEEITRNHRCKTIDELIELIFDWFGYKRTFAIETSAYPQAVAA